MRILHITATHLNPAGGVPVVLNNLAEYQNSIDGVKSKVISISKKNMTTNSSLIERVSSSDLSFFIKKFMPDVAILHSFFYLEYIRAAKILIKFNVPYFIEPHGSFGKDALNKSKLKKLVANKTIFHSLLRNAIGYIFLNDKEKNDSLFRKNNDIVVPNGIASICLDKKENNDDDFFFYFIGRYDIHHKGIDRLLSALKILDKKEVCLDFRFFGNGSIKQIDFIKNSVNEFKNVRASVNNAIYGCEKDLLLNRCGVMLLTSRYEGMPMTVLEAWAYGNPCIVTPEVNLQKEIIDHDLGFACNDQPESIANTILLAKETYGLNRSDYIIRCQQYVEENYLWKDIAKKSICEYKKIITKK